MDPAPLTGWESCPAKLRFGVGRHNSHFKNPNLYQYSLVSQASPLLHGSGLARETKYSHDRMSQLLLKLLSTASSHLALRLNLKKNKKKNKKIVIKPALMKKPGCSLHHHSMREQQYST